MKIGITLGDPAGIGPEILLKSASSLIAHKNLAIYGNKEILSKTAQDLKLKKNYHLLKPIVIDCVRTRDFHYGTPTRSTGRMAIESIDRALKDETDVLITAPIVKDVIRNFVPGFVGHTEYFAQYFDIKEYAMVGIWRRVRVMLLTTHLPLRKAIKKVTSAEVLKKLRLLHSGLQKYFRVCEPVIGVSALNPHAFEFSQGEDERIQQGILSARSEQICAFGPFPADSLFNRTFDGFLTMYHDQAMTYLKSKKNGLNFTLGLPLIRLSPLYGAALDIAGRGVADCSGFIEACNRGVDIYKNVRNYEKQK